MEQNGAKRSLPSGSESSAPPRTLTSWSSYHPIVPSLSTYSSMRKREDNLDSLSIYSKIWKCHLREEEGKDDKLHGERRQRRVSGKSLDLSASRRTDDDSTLPRTCQLVPFVLKVKCIFWLPVRTRDVCARRMERNVDVKLGGVLHSIFAKGTRMTSHDTGGAQKNPY